MASKNDSGYALAYKIEARNTLAFFGKVFQQHSALYCIFFPKHLIFETQVQWHILVLYMSFDKFLLAVESRDLSQADKSIIDALAMYAFITY